MSRKLNPNNSYNYVQIIFNLYSKIFEQETFRSNIYAVDHTELPLWLNNSISLKAGAQQSTVTFEHLRYMLGTSI